MSDQQHNNSIVDTVATTASFLLRVKVINEISGLSKDLLVEIRDDDDSNTSTTTSTTTTTNNNNNNLFDAIYDNTAVKKANVRKWNSDVIQKVKSGSHEIVCSVTVVWNNNNNDNDKTTITTTHHTYSIEDLKHTSARQLHHKLMVVCSEERDCDFNCDCDRIRLELQCVEKTKKQENTAAPKLPFHHPAISNNSGDGPSLLRCPFSGVVFDESSVLRQFQKTNE
jgi:hypothetical protein